MKKRMITVINKALATVFAVVMIILSCSIASFAVDSGNNGNDATENKGFSDIREVGGVSLHCSFGEDGSTVNIGGTVAHELLISYSDYTVDIYDLSFSETEEDILNSPNAQPIASSPIAIRFDFVVKNIDILQKYRSYFAVLRSPDNEKILATYAKYPSAVSDYEYDMQDKNSFKGIETELVSSASNAGAGRVIIPVYLNRLFSESSSGYLYQSGGENVYFNQNYIESLDAKVRTATAAEAKVYFRILVDGDCSGLSIAKIENGAQANYYLPDIYDRKTLATVDASMSFLAKRYEDFQSGRLCGIIVGKEADSISESFCAADDFLLYAEQYFTYMLVVSNAVRKSISDCDIVVPISSRNTYSEAEQANREDFTPTAVIEALLELFDKRLSGEFDFSLMLETDSAPFSLDKGIVDGKIDYNQEPDGEYICAQNIEVFVSYFNSLKSRYASAPKGFMLLWNASEDISGNALTAAYVYSYLKSLEYEELSCFTVSLAETERNDKYSAFYALRHIFEKIDTSESENAISNLLSYFGCESWAQVLQYENNPELPVTQAVSNADAMNALPDGIKGQFSYFDFSTSIALNDWFKGNLCNNLSLRNMGSGLALNVTMSTSKYGEYSEVLCLYEYSEKFSYTPYVAFRVQIDAEKAENSLFEILVTGGSGREKIIASKTVTVGEEAVVLFDISDYSSEYIDYWKVGVRSLDGFSGGLTLQLYDIVGYSTEYDSDTLGNMINEERMRIRNQSLSNEDSADMSTVIIIVSVAVLIISLGVGIFICIRPGDEEKRKKNGSD